MTRGNGGRSPWAGPALSLRARALALLAQREHSEAELRRKLARHLRARQDGLSAAQTGAQTAAQTGARTASPTVPRTGPRIGHPAQAAAEVEPGDPARPGMRVGCGAQTGDALPTRRVADDDPAADAAAEPGSGAERIDSVIDWLRAQGYLSEARFVESRVHARAARYGNLRIRLELAQHGVALTPEAAQALRDSELQRATAVWRRKYGVAPADALQRARQSRFLAQRGFSSEVVARVLRDAGAHDGDGALDDD